MGQLLGQQKGTTMKRTIVTPYHQPSQTIDAGPPHSELRDKVQAAAAAGLALATLLTIGVIAFSTIINLSLVTIGTLTFCAFLAGLAFSAWLVLQWSRAVATREWDIDDYERDRRWATEDAEQKHLKELRDSMQETEQPTQIERINEVAYAILASHYSKRSTSREHCVKSGIASQEEWNTVNQVLKALQWKKGNTLTIPYSTLSEAWSIYQHDVMTPEGQPNKIHVITDTGAEKRITI